MSQNYAIYFTYFLAFFLTTEENYYLKIKFDENENSKIVIQGKMQRSEERKTFLMNHPITQTCKEQIKQGNDIQPACMNATLNANYLDKYNFLVNYENVPTKITDYIYNAYKVLQQLASNKENTVFAKNKEGQLNITIQFDQNLKSTNISIKAPTLSTEFEGINIPQYAIPILVQHSRYGQLVLMQQTLFKSQPLFSCALDENRLTTFNNRSYPLSLGNCFHVMSMHVSQHGEKDYAEHDTHHKMFAVLVKDDTPESKEVQIVLGNDEITLKKSNSKTLIMKVNGEEMLLSEKRLTKWENGMNSIQAYLLSNGNNAKVDISSHGIQLTYDGKRVLLSVQSGYRNRLHGLCGKFNEDVITDLTTPQGCILKNHEVFAASYAISDSTCQGPARNNKRKIQESVCYRKEVLFGDIISEEDNGYRAIEHNWNQIKIKSNEKQGQSCSTFKSKILEHGTKTCFSLLPQMHCNIPQCSETKMVEKIIDFHCVSDLNTARLWKGLIRKGALPDFSQKKSNLKAIFKIPENCVLNI